MRKSDVKPTHCFFLVLSLCLLVLAGCGAKVEQQGDQGPVFFPPPPNEPRIQFLKAINSSADVVGKSESFSMVAVVGKVEKQGDFPIAKPYGVATHKGKIYICDAGASQVFIMDLVNRTFEKLKGNFSTGKLKKPINLVVDEEGRLYVTDTSRKEVLVYDQSGNYLRSLGSKLDWKPVDIGAYGKFLYVTDIKNNEVKVLDRENGTLVSGFGATGAEDKLDNLSMPLGLSVTKKGDLRVVNMGGGRVVTLDRDGHVLSSFGKMGDGFGQFGRPKGIADDNQGRIYVVDTAHQNVQVFSDKARLLTFFGDPGLPKGSMNMPVAIAVTTDNLDYYQTLAAPGFILEQVIIVTNQYGDAKVSIYGLGEMKK